MKSVFIDAGHNYSGADTGATGSGLKEQNITWYIANKLCEILKKFNIFVGMSRQSLTSNIGNTSVNDSLKARVSMANKLNTDIFVSIHCNSGGGTGSETYCRNNNGKAYNLAKSVEAAVVGETGFFDRGVKNADYYVIRESLMPAILVETAFIDNADDAKILGFDNGQALIAKGIAEGILNYFGIEYIDLGGKGMIENVYNYTLEVPEWGRSTIQKLMDKGLIKGDENGKLGINDTMLRILVINDRVGLYS